MKLLKKIFPCFFKKRKIQYSPHQWNKEELELAQALGVSRGAYLEIDDVCKWASEKRMEYQLSIPGISHDWFFGVSQEMKELGREGNVELLSYGYRNPLQGFLNSESHSDAIFNLKYNYVGISVREHEGKKYCCVIMCKNVFNKKS